MFASLMSRFQLIDGVTYERGCAYTEAPAFGSLVSRCTLSRDLTRCTIRESLKYLCQPEGPSGSNSRNNSERFTWPPRDAADSKEFTVTEAIATRCTDSLRPAAAGQAPRCRLSTVVNCCAHSFGCTSRATVCDAGWTRKALNGSAMKRTGPSDPRRSQKSQSAEYQSASSSPPERIAGLRRNTGDGMAMKF